MSTTSKGLFVCDDSSVDKLKSKAKSDKMRGESKKTIEKECEMMGQRFAVVLAAGQGSRMKTKYYKVLHTVAGKPMVGHVIDQLNDLGLDQVVTVIGHGADQVQAYIQDRSAFALQEEQLGTAHAVDQARSLLADRQGTTVVLSGDTPLLTAETLKAAFDHHEHHQAKATVLSAEVEEPFSYGRIIRNDQGHIERIVEEKDATAEERQITEINTGTYLFDNQALFDSLPLVTNDNQQGEYYLPDVIEILKSQNQRVVAYKMADVNEALGVNDRQALAQAEQLMRQRINSRHMANGVSMVDPASTYIDCEVKIGPDTLIEPQVYIKGQTTIGEDCVIGSQTVIEDSQIAGGVRIQSSTVEQSQLDEGAKIGPYAHLRPNSHLGQGVKIGNFVEVKNSVIGQHSKAGHLTYIGDADVGEGVNFGCGSVVVNYDGHKKHRTSIGDRAFIGCNVNLVAPLVLDADTFVAAGSTITKDVAADSLAIERAEEKHIEHYVSKKRKQWEED